MKQIDIRIQLDPVEDGASWGSDSKNNDKLGALIIGTNGEYRIAEEREVMEIFDRLSEAGSSDYMGKTSFIVVYNGKKVLYTGESQFIVGSVMIVKGTSKGIVLLNTAEIEEAKKEFESRLAILCGSGIQFSAYEIG